MPAVTWITDQEARDWSTVSDDKDCDELLQELNKVSGRRWVIQVLPITIGRSLWQWIMRKPGKIIKLYTLYLDCHGEWQVMNLVTPDGGSNFHAHERSREDVMNYMLGYIGGSRK